MDAHCLSVTRSCRCVRLTRAAYYREPVAPEIRDAEIIDLLNELVEERPRRGFWKCYALIRRRGHQWNHKRVYRVYCSLKLNQKRHAKRRVPTWSKGVRLNFL